MKFRQNTQPPGSSFSSRLCCPPSTPLVDFIAGLSLIGRPGVAGGRQVSLERPPGAFELLDFRLQSGQILVGPGCDRGVHLDRRRPRRRWQRQRAVFHLSAVEDLVGIVPRAVSHQLPGEAEQGVYANQKEEDLPDDPQPEEARVLDAIPGALLVDVEKSESAGLRVDVTRVYLVMGLVLVVSLHDIVPRLLRG